MRPFFVRANHSLRTFHLCYLCIAQIKRCAESCILAFRLPLDIERRLDALAKKTGRSKSFYAREAILRQIEDIKDKYLPRRRVTRGGPRATLEMLDADIKKCSKG